MKADEDMPEEVGERNDAVMERREGGRSQEGGQEERGIMEPSVLYE